MWPSIALFSLYHCKSGQGSREEGWYAKNIVLIIQYLGYLLFYFKRYKMLLSWVAF